MQIAEPRWGSLVSQSYSGVPVKVAMRFAKVKHTIKQCFKANRGTSTKWAVLYMAHFNSLMIMCCVSQKNLNLDLADYILLSFSKLWKWKPCLNFTVPVKFDGLISINVIIVGNIKVCRTYTAQKDQMLCYRMYIMNYLSCKHMRWCLYQHLGGKTRVFAGRANIYLSKQ